MAAFDTSRTLDLSAGRFTRVLANAFGTVAAWNDERVTRKALNQLSSRELEDIGLCYADIEKIAKRAN